MSAYQLIGSAGTGERDRRYSLVLGAQYPLGYPRHFDTTLLADVFTNSPSALEKQTWLGLRSASGTSSLP
jgi:hypothetical protein